MPPPGTTLAVRPGVIDLGPFATAGGLNPPVAAAAPWPHPAQPDFSRDTVYSDAFPLPYRSALDMNPYSGETPEMRDNFRRGALQDGTFRAAILGKVAAVASLDVGVSPVDRTNPVHQKAADWVMRTVRATGHGWHGLIRKILRPAFVDGWSALEITLKPVQTPTGPLWGLAHCRSLDTNYLRLQFDQYRNVTGVVSVVRGMADYDPRKVLRFAHNSVFENAFGESDARAVYRAINLIEHGFRLWKVAVEVFGAPFLVGKIGKPERRAKMSEALQYARAAGYIVIAPDDAVELLNFASATSFEQFENLVNKCREEIFLSIRGAYGPFLNDTGNAERGDTGIQKVSADSLEYLLALDVAQVLVTQLFPVLVAPNFGEGIDLECQIGGVNWAETSQAVDVLAKYIQIGGNVDAEFAARITKITGATDPAKQLKPPQPPGPPGMPGGDPFGGGPGGPQPQPGGGDLDFADATTHLKPRDIRTDPARLQFRPFDGADGLSADRRTAEAYDPARVGRLAVWRDPADKQTYLVDGHKRLAAAKRAGASAVPVEYIDAATADEAREWGRRKNERQFADAAGHEHGSDGRFTGKGGGDSASQDPEVTDIHKWGEEPVHEPDYKAFEAMPEHRVAHFEQHALKILRAAGPQGVKFSTLLKRINNPDGKNTVSIHGEIKPHTLTAILLHTEGIEHRLADEKIRLASPQGKDHSADASGHEHGEHGRFAPKGGGSSGGSELPPPPKNGSIHETAAWTNHPGHEPLRGVPDMVEALAGKDGTPEGNPLGAALHNYGIDPDTGEADWEDTAVGAKSPYEQRIGLARRLADAHDEAAAKGNAAGAALVGKALAMYGVTKGDGGKWTMPGLHGAVDLTDHRKGKQFADNKVLRETTDKAGHHIHRWMSPEDAAAASGGTAAKPDSSPAKPSGKGAAIRAAGPAAVALAKRVAGKMGAVAVGLHAKCLEAGITPATVLDTVDDYFNIFRWEGSAIHHLTGMRADVLYAVAPHVAGYAIVKLRRYLSGQPTKAMHADGDDARYEIAAEVIGAILAGFGVPQDDLPTAEEIADVLADNGQEFADRSHLVWKEIEITRGGKTFKSKRLVRPDQGSGQELARLLRKSQADGGRVLADVARQAVQRALKAGGVHARGLFNKDELKRVSDALAAVNASADLLGRVRVRELADRADPQHFSDTPFGTVKAFGEDVVIATPEGALDYFLSLVPKLGVDPERFGESQRRKAFTLAKSTDETLTARVQAAIANALRDAKGRADAAADIDNILDAAGVSNRADNYSDMVFRTNAADSYQTAMFEEMRHPDVADQFPAWKYLAITDSRARPHHAAKNGKVFAAGVAFADVRGTAAGDVVNCRCSFQPLTQSQLDRLQSQGTQVETNW